MLLKPRLLERHEEFQLLLLQIAAVGRQQFVQTRSSVHESSTHLRALPSMNLVVWGGLRELRLKKKVKRRHWRKQSFDILDGYCDAAAITIQAYLQNTDAYSKHIAQNFAKCMGVDYCRL